MDTLGYENRTFNQLTTSLTSSIENLAGYLKVDLNNSGTVQSPSQSSGSDAAVSEVKPYASASIGENGTVNLSVNIPAALRENELTKGAVEKLDGRVEAATNELALKNKAKTDAQKLYDEKKAAEDKLINEVNAFDKDLQDFSNGSYSENQLKYWREKFVNEHGHLMSEEQKAAIQASKTQSELMAICLPMVGSGENLGILDEQISKLSGETDTAEAALIAAEAAIKPAEEAFVKEIEAANKEFSDTLQTLAADPKNAYLRDFLRAHSSGNPVVGFRDENLRVHKESLEDSIAAIISKGELNPILQKALSEQRMLTEEEMKALSTEEKGMAKLVALLAVYAADGKTKIQDQDISLLEGMIMQQDALLAKDDKSLSMMKVYDIEIGKALKGFLEKGVVDAEGKPIRGAKELAAHWGTTEQAARHIFGSIDEGFFYRNNFAGLASADPSIANKVATEVSRLLADRTNRKPWYGELNTQDGIAALLGIIAPIPALGPIGTGVAQVAARRESSGILSLALTAYSLIDRFAVRRQNNNNNGGGNGNGNGNGGGSGEP